MVFIYLFYVDFQRLQNENQALREENHALRESNSRAGENMHSFLNFTFFVCNLGSKLPYAFSFCSFGWQRLTSRAGEASWDNVEDVCLLLAIRYNLQTTPVVVCLIPTGATCTCSRPRYKCHSLVVEGPGLTTLFFYSGNPCRCRSDPNAATSWRVWRCCA